MVPAGAPLATRSFLLLVAGHFLQALGYASMLLLPLYLQHLRASRTEIGIIMATGAVSGLAVRPLVGWCLDNFGRKPTLVAGTLALVLGMVTTGAVTFINWLVYLQRVIVGIGIGTLFTAYFTFAADLVPISRRTEGLALFGISGLVPMLVNPFADRIGIEPPALRWFFPAVGAAIAPSLLALWLIPEQRPSQRRPARARDAVVALRRRPLWPVWLASAIFSGMVAVFFTFATVAADRRGVQHAASLWLTYACGAVVVRLFGARIPDRVGPSNFVAPAIGSYVAALLLAAHAASLQAFLVAALFAGIGHGYAFPVLTSQVVSRAPQTFRGSALAMFTATWGFTELMASPVFGLVADRHGDAVMFFSAAVLGIASLGAWLWLEHRYGAEA